MYEVRAAGPEQTRAAGTRAGPIPWGDRRQHWRAMRTEVKTRASTIRCAAIGAGTRSESVRTHFRLRARTRASSTGNGTGIVCATRARARMSLIVCA